MFMCLYSHSTQRYFMRVSFCLAIFTFFRTVVSSDLITEMMIEVENRELALMGARLGLRADPEDEFKQAEVKLAQHEYRTAIKSTLKQIDKYEHKCLDAKARLEAEHRVQNNVLDMYDSRVNDIMESVSLLCINLNSPQDASEVVPEVKEEIWTPILEASMDLVVPRDRARRNFFVQASAKVRELDLAGRVRDKAVKRSILRALKEVRQRIREQYPQVDFPAKLGELSMKLRIIKIRRERVGRHLRSNLFQ
jgi:hypothetical protein